MKHLGIHLSALTPDVFPSNAGIFNVESDLGESLINE